MRQGLRLFAAIATFSALAHPGAQQPPAQPPLRLAIAGLVHGHVSGFLRGAQGAADVQIVGIFDPDAALPQQYGERYKLPGCGAVHRPRRRCSTGRSPRPSRRSRTRCDHPAIVEAAARAAHRRDDGEAARGQQRRRAADQARGRCAAASTCSSTTRRPGIRATAAIWTLMKEQKRAGEIRKMVAMDGHQGPKAINVQPEFFAWLSDPVKNGGGALFDFGCYGANLMTWLMDNQRPLARHRRHAALPAGRLSARRRRGDDPPGVSERAGDHPGVVELAVRAARTSRSTASADLRSPPAAPACVSRFLASPTRGDAGAARSRRARLDRAPARRRERHAQTERLVVAREQSDCDGDSRGRTRVSENAQGRAARSPLASPLVNRRPGSDPGRSVTHIPAPGSDPGRWVTHIRKDCGYDEAAGLRGGRSATSTTGTTGTTAAAAGAATGVTPSCCNTAGTLSPSASSCCSMLKTMAGLTLASRPRLLLPLSPLAPP